MFDTYEINGLLFKRGCLACPESFDVYSTDNEDEIRAYVRLRYGKLRVYVPDVGGKLVYHYTWEGDEWKGCFDTEEECIMHLTKIAEVINKGIDNALKAPSPAALEKARKHLFEVMRKYNTKAIDEAAKALPDIAIEIGKKNKINTGVYDDQNSRST